MSAESVRSGTRNTDPIEHNLVSMEMGGETVFVRVSVRRTDESGWRGRIVFARNESEPGISTAEILYADNEADFWQCVSDLNLHHIKNLYRSVTG